MGFWNIVVMGFGGKQYTVKIPENASVDDLLKLVAEKEAVDSDTLYLIYSNKKLLCGEGKTLKDMNMKDGSLVQSVQRTRGGAKRHAAPAEFQ